MRPKFIHRLMAVASPWLVLTASCTGTSGQARSPTAVSAVAPAEVPLETQHEIYERNAQAAVAQEAAFEAQGQLAEADFVGRLDDRGANYGMGGLGLRGTGSGGGGDHGIIGAMGHGEAEAGDSFATIGRGGQPASERRERSANRPSKNSNARYGIASATPAAPPPPAALPQNGVFASNFVGGGGVAARLEDLLDRGVLVDGRMVRLAALEDRGELTYPVPEDDAVALYSELERTSVDAHGDTVHLQIALIGRQGEAPPRPDLDVRLVIDCSGSMAERWNETMQSAQAFVDRLSPHDRLGIVAYSDDAELALAPTTDRNAARRVLSSLAPGGGTNIGAALEVARQNAPRRDEPSDIGLVVLVSDGKATVGQTNAGELASVARAMFDATGVLTTTIGLGTDFDEETMLSIAREGGGSYHFVRRAADIDGILRDELVERIDTIAQALRVRIELAPGVVARRVYGSRLLSEAEHQAVRATEIATDHRLAAELGIATDRQDEENGLRMHIPSFRRGDQHVILLEVEVPGGALGSLAGVARVHLDYKDLDGGANHHEVVAVNAPRAPAEEASVAVRRPVKRTVLAFRAGDAMQQAAEAIANGQSDQARTILGEHVTLLRAAADLWRDEAMRRDAALLDQYATVIGRAWDGFSGDDRRVLAMAMQHYGDRRLR